MRGFAAVRNLRPGRRRPGLLSMLLDRAAVGEGLADRLAAGAPDEFGCVVDAMGRRVYAGPPKPSAKVVQLRGKRKAAK
jgi:hypothetical protein